MKVLMVCLGNICRSPMAEGIMRKKAEEYGLDITVDSAGTGGWHVGQYPDKRAIQTAKQFGVDISRIKGRKFSKNDFAEFDYIYVMDRSNYGDVIDMAGNIEDKRKVSLLLNAANPNAGHEVPDPYYGGADGFIEVFEMMDKACEAIVEEMKQLKTHAGKLYLIPSLLSEDNSSVIPSQTKEILHSLDIFIVENEKTARHFLKAMSYPKPLQQTEMKVLDEHTKIENVAELLAPLMAGKNVGLISEAGCPAVADPGSDLVRLAHEKNIHIIPLTGPSSILLALMGSGLNGQGFSFLGYLPRDRNERIKALKDLERIVSSKNQTQIFIEAPYRNQHLFEDILAHVNKNLSLCIACNLTGKDEFIKTMSVEEWKKNIRDINKKPVVFLVGR